MTQSQRDTIRQLFGELRVSEAKAQFEVVAELTGARIGSVGELDERVAGTLIRMLPGKIERSRRVNTGNAWNDREEDTWIDRL